MFDTFNNAFPNPVTEPIPGLDTRRRTITVSKYTSWWQMILNINIHNIHKNGFWEKQDERAKRWQKHTLTDVFVDVILSGQNMDNVRKWIITTSQQTEGVPYNSEIWVYKLMSRRQATVIELLRSLRGWGFELYPINYVLSLSINLLRRLPTSLLIIQEVEVRFNFGVFEVSRCCVQRTVVH